MKIRTKYQSAVANKYDTFSLLLVVIAVIFIIGVFVWFGYKNEQLEQEISRFK